MSAADKHTSTNQAKHQCQHIVAQNTVGRFHEALIGLLSTFQPRRLLSAGCGEGFDLRHILESEALAPEASFGLDFSFPAVKAAQQMLEVYSFDAVHGNIYDLPFDLRQFDAILCLEVLEHLEHPEEVLAAIARKYRGHCVFSVPNEPFFMLTRMVVLRRDFRRLGNHPEHIQRWSKRRFARLIDKYFTIDQVLTPYPWTMVLCHK
jgi:2-polyprenyl-3-methyl-5-hydroxy-6-metoxy-1,4-benzoquinol methylase